MNNALESAILDKKEFNNSVISLRLMEENDIKDVVQLDEHLFSLSWSQESFTKEFENPISTVYVTTHKNKIMGYGVIWTFVDELEIVKIAIAPDYRQLGIASWMLKHIFKQAQSQNMLRAFIEVRVSNKSAIQLYKKFRFTNDRIRKDYYSSPKEDALLMTANL